MRILWLILGDRKCYSGVFGEFDELSSDEAYECIEKTDLPSLEGQPIETNGVILTGLDLRTSGVQKIFEKDPWCYKTLKMTCGVIIGQPQGPFM